MELDNISSEVKKDLLDEEICRANDFLREEQKKLLKYIGKVVLIGGSVVAKVAAALAAFL